MKTAWTILKVILLIALVIGAFFGYRFFKIWQDNNRPEVIEAAWKNNETTLGGSATLLVTLKAPWHREITTASPTTHPDSFLPVRQQAAFQKGNLEPSGFREWKISVPLVATEKTLPEGQTVSFPIKQLERISPSSVNVPLPALTILLPEEIPTDPENPTAFLQPEPPAKIDTTPSFEEEKSYLGWIITLAVVLIVIVTFFSLRKAAQVAAIPPWERAMGKLDKIDISANSTVVVASLTDILKDYTSERFGLAANTKTSSEFLKIVKTIPELSSPENEELPWLASVADAAKFAGRKPTEETPPRALSVVREFVENTTPQESSANEQDA